MNGAVAALVAATYPQIGGSVFTRGFLTFDHG